MRAVTSTAVQAIVVTDKEVEVAAAAEEKAVTIVNAHLKSHFLKPPTWIWFPVMPSQTTEKFSRHHIDS